MKFLLLFFLIFIFGINESFATVASDTILFEDYPYALTLDDQNRVYVLTLRVNTFSIQIIENNAVIDQMQFNREYGQPGFLQIDSSKNIAYVGNIFNPSISVIDLHTKSLIENINLEYCENALMNNLHLDTATNQIYFLIEGVKMKDGCDQQKSSTIGILDTTNGEIIKEIHEFHAIRSLFFDHEANQIIVKQSFVKDILLLDIMGNNSVVKTGLGNDESLEYAYDKKSKLFFEGYTNGTIAIYDLKKLVLDKTIQIPNHKQNQQFRLIDGNDKLFIILDEYHLGDFSSKNAHLVIYHIIEDLFSNPIQIGQRPLENVFDKDLNLLYTLNYVQESISVVDIENEKVVETIESFRFEIVSVIVVFLSVCLIILLIVKRSSKNRVWILGGIGSIFGIFVPWSYQFFLREHSSIYVQYIDISIPMWPIAVAFPVSISIAYIIFLFARFRNLREKTSQIYYVSKDIIIETFYDTKIGKILSVLIPLLISFLIYQMTEHIPIQAFINTLPISEIIGAIPLSEENNETASSFFTQSPILQIILAGIGPLWLIILRRMWNVEFNQILEFDEETHGDSIESSPKMKFRGSRSLVLFIFFSLLFFVGLEWSSADSEENLQNYQRSASYYTTINFLFIIIPTTLTFLFAERFLFENFPNKQNRYL